MLRITQGKPEKKWYPLKQDNGGRLQKSNTEVELTVEWLHDTFVTQKEANVRKNYSTMEPAAGDVTLPLDLYRMNVYLHCLSCLSFFLVLSLPFSYNL